jgi:hypothetical protein
MGPALPVCTFPWRKIAPTTPSLKKDVPLSAADDQDSDLSPDEVPLSLLQRSVAYSLQSRLPQLPNLNFLLFRLRSPKFSLSDVPKKFFFHCNS